MLAFIAILGIIISSCGKEYSVDPDIRKADSTATAAQVAFKMSADSIITAAQIGILGGNADSTNNYITIPIKVSKAGSYRLRAIAYFGGDSLVLQGNGYVSTADSIFKLYPSNINDFSTGSYTTDSIPGNKVYWNDTLTKYHLNLTITVDNSNVNPPSNNVLTGDSSWACIINNKDSLTGNFDMVTSINSVTMLSSSTMIKGDYVLALTFVLPTDFSQLPITLDGKSASKAASINLTGTGGVFIGGYGVNPDDATITINKYDSKTKKMEGTFEGTVKDMQTSTIMNVNKGVFKITLP